MIVEMVIVERAGLIVNGSTGKDGQSAGQKIPELEGQVFCPVFSQVFWLLSRHLHSFGQLLQRQVGLGKAVHISLFGVRLWVAPAAVQDASIRKPVREPPRGGSYLLLHFVVVGFGPATFRYRTGGPFMPLNLGQAQRRWIRIMLPLVP